MPEVIASCFVESIGTNVLFVKDIIPNSYYIIAYINDYYNYIQISYEPKNVEMVKHAFENELISIQDRIRHSHKIYYSICINRIYANFDNYLTFNNTIMKQFLTENYHLFKEDRHPILK